MPNTLEHDMSQSAGYDPRVSASELETLDRRVEELAHCMVETADLEREDRLYPTDPMVFQTNAMNVAHGACGTALFLNRTRVGLPLEHRDWLLARKIGTHWYPPGLLSGIAGVAWTFLELGLTERALELMALVPESPLAFDRVDFHNGVAGWGMAALAFWRRLGDSDLRDLALRAGEHLVTTAQTSEEGAHWPREEEEAVRLGFAYGGSGIALFLLYLWRETDDRRYLDLARDAMRFEIAHGKESGEALVWGVHTDDEGSRPYWLRGGAGVVTTLARFYAILGDDEYLRVARRAALDCSVFFSGAPHLFEGLAGMGEALLDLHLATGEVDYLEQARRKAVQTLLYRIEHAGGIAIPGRYLFRISHDFGIGGAGVGLFLQRAISPGARLFHDLDTDLGFGRVPSDEPSMAAAG